MKKNQKEAFLSMLQGNNTSYLEYGFNAFPPGLPLVMDPITARDVHTGEKYLDSWGSTWRCLPSDPGAIPLTNDENKVIKDIENWRDYVKFPTFDQLDWGMVEGQLANINRDETLVMVPSFLGLFERAHVLMPFEDVLINMMEEPEAMYDLFGAIADWKIQVFELVIDHIHPDIIHSHDDWGSLNSLFFSPDVFQELLKPHYKRMYDYIHSRGVLVQHHSDCYCQGLEKDMVDIGIDMWQGVTITNDIQEIKKNTDGKLLLMGGLNQQLIDSDTVPEDVIRKEVDRAIDTYAEGGAWLPCFPSIVPVCGRTLAPVIDECNRYGQIWLENHK